MDKATLRKLDRITERAEKFASKYWSKYLDQNGYHPEWARLRLDFIWRARRWTKIPASNYNFF